MVKYAELTAAQKAELTGECIYWINQSETLAHLETVGKMIAGFEPDARNREVLKRVYSKKLKEIKSV
jgi:hypothetical protein